MAWPISRRTFLKAATVAAPVALGARAVLHDTTARAALPPTLTRVDALPTTVTRSWLAPQYWSNRLQDWQLTDGRIECLSAQNGGQTVGVLTRSVIAGNLAGALSVRTGTIAAGSGFSGFLIGAGAGALDYRAAALVMGASGEGGGFLATYDADGNVRFRDHTSETDQFAYAELEAVNRIGAAPARAAEEDVVLRLDITPAVTGGFDLTLSARSSATGTLLSQATRAGVADAELVGGISLFSTATGASGTARYWFRELRAGGAKIPAAGREAGPVLGTLYSLNGKVLKLGAQFMPIGSTDPQRATLQIRAPGTTAWRTVQTVTIGVGFVALFRVTTWDGTRPWQFRVTWATGTAQQATYTGTVRSDPKTAATLTVAAVSCTVHATRHLNAPSNGRATLPGAHDLGLYTPDTMYFPYRELVTNLGKQHPDLLIASGDQYYETKPTGCDRRHPHLDMLGRWYLWLWSFSELTRTIPTVCQVDDHDVYEANLWGWSGAAAPNGNFAWGGYTMPAQWVNEVQRVQCGHNPDAFDPAPVLRGIGVYYAAFSYGGVSFALLEDRKFKDTNQYGTDPSGAPIDGRVLLGDRQEAFLEAWTTMNPGQPKICLSQTVFACVQTDPDGRPLSDPDSNGAPGAARNRAVGLLQKSRALIISGDQHMGSLVRYGVAAGHYADGPMQFTPPAAGTGWQRWFTPNGSLPNNRGENTGDFTDGFGNRFRVLAVANPKISYADVHSIQPGTNDVNDRTLKREGYGIVRVDKVRHTHRIECWPSDVDPTAAGAAQFPGWPYTVAISAL